MIIFELQISSLFLNSDKLHVVTSELVKIGRLLEVLQKLTNFKFRNFDFIIFGIPQKS
jgi:hypothetical protein